MRNRRLKVLLIEDNPDDVRLIWELFSDVWPGGFDLSCAGLLSNGLECLSQEEFDAVLLDLSLPDSQGFETFTRVHARMPEIPIIILTGFDDDTLAIRAVQEGAQDYLVKGQVDGNLLKCAISYAIERKRAQEALRRARDQLEMRVQERTAKLAEANQELKLEIAERRKAEESLRQSQQMLRLVMNNIPQTIFWKDRDSVFQGCNQNFAVDAGLDSPEAIVGKTDYDLAWTKEEADSYREWDRRVMETNTPEYHIIEPQLQASGRRAWLDTSKIPLHDARGEVVGILGTYEDITDRKYLEELLAVERKILEMIAAGLPLQETLDALTLMTERMALGTVSSVLMLDEEKGCLSHASAISLPREYIQAVDGIPIGPKSGSCGTAAYFGRTVVVEDISTDPLWADWRPLAETYGLRACWSVPIRSSNGKVLGTFALYPPQPGQPSQQEIQLVETAAHLAGIAIQRKKSEDALKKSEEKYRTLFEESRDAICIVSREGDFLDVNQSALELFGCQREGILRKNILEFYVHPEERKKFRQKIEHHGSVRDYEIKMRRLDGQEMDCLVSAILKLAEDGTILGYEGIVRDITGDKKAERALRESEARYRAIVEDQTELIVRFLPDKRISFVNEAFCRYFNTEYRELIGRSFLPLIAWEDQRIVEEHLASLNQANPVGTLEQRVTLPSGEIRWQKWTNRMIFDDQNRLREFQSVGRDITERKMMEEALQNSAEKIKLFAYSVSHDLKSPAIGVHGLTQLLVKRYGKTLDTAGGNICEQILKSSEQIVALVEKINLYISTREVPLLIEKVNLKRVLQMIKDEFSTRLSIRRIRWSEPESMPEIKADRLAIIRVLRNLVDNALKYGGDALSEIEIRYDKTDAFHMLSVRDDGQGINFEDTEKLFGLFQRHETARGIEGAGLGLAIVKEIVEQHGGEVRVEPGPERGTVFHLSISKRL